MRYISLLLVLIISFFCNAQECSKESLAKKEGQWKPGFQGSVRNVSATDLAKEKAVLSGIHKMISEKYRPTGCEASYSTVFGKHLPAAENWIADPYHYAIYVLRYLCDPNDAGYKKFYVDHSTPTTVNIAANVIFSLNDLYAADLAADDMRGYLKLKTKPQLKDGYYFMGEEVVADGHLKNKVIQYRWLITYTDTLPFAYLTRKEYLLIQKKRLAKTINDSPSEKTYLETFLNNINEYLKKPEGELSQPAICMWNEEERFEKFVPEGTRGSFFAVQPNKQYYHKKLPKSSPQFFSVTYTLAQGDVVFEENIANIKKAVDFAALRNMLGK
jgi:hypothetical protein